MNAPRICCNILYALIALYSASACFVLACCLVMSPDQIADTRPMARTIVVYANLSFWCSAGCAFLVLILRETADNKDWSTGKTLACCLGIIILLGILVTGMGALCTWELLVIPAEPAPSSLDLLLSALLGAIATGLDSVLVMFAETGAAAVIFVKLTYWAIAGELEAR